MAEETKDLKLVPETLLKRRHNLDELKAKRIANQKKKGNRHVFSKSRKAIYVKKAETFLAQARARKHHDIRFQRVMKKGMQTRASSTEKMETKTLQDDSAEEESTIPTQVTYQSNSVGAKTVFCIRIHDNVSMTGRIRKVLYKLRLKSIYDGVFLPYTTETSKLLHLVEPWVLYGTPSKAMVEDLIRKRGHTGKNKNRITLSDNTIIERALGETTGIICVEDLVHEICDGQEGDSFQAACTFLSPFTLRAPKSRFETQKLNDKQGKEYGDKGEQIDEFIKTML